MQQQHGTVSYYVNAKCRCDECRKANADYNRRWRERSKETQPACSVPGCSKPQTSKKLCDMHYRRLRLYGDPGEATSRKRPNGWNGGLSRHGYRILWIPEEKRAVAEHVFVMEQHLGRRLEQGESVHHKNGIRHDNRIANLELWVKPQPAGQRPEDLVAWVIEHYRDLVIEHLNF